MSVWARLKGERLAHELRRLGYDLHEAVELLARYLGREVSPQTPDPGTQRLGPLP